MIFLVLLGAALWIGLALFLFWPVIPRQLPPIVHHKGKERL